MNQIKISFKQLLFVAVYLFVVNVVAAGYLFMVNVTAVCLFMVIGSFFFYINDQIFM